MADNFTCRFSDSENCSLCEISQSTCTKDCDKNICNLCDNPSKLLCANCTHYSGVTGVLREVMEIVSDRYSKSSSEDI